MKSQTEVICAGVGLAGLVLLAIAYAQRRGTLSPVGAALYLVAALVVVSWTVMGIGTSRRRAREQAERQRREEQARLRKEAEEAAKRAATAVNARRTTSLAGTTITVHRRGSSE